MNKKTALILLFLILGTLVVFHLLILIQLIPYDKVWGGKIDTIDEMRAFESFSILLNSFMLFILALKYRQLNRGIRHKLIDILIWMFFAFFVLNTFGNLYAESIQELILGTVLTLTSAVLCLIIVRKEK
jgi:NADH:ubiquinone oxidoreductase subunit 2 (subunit N)